MSSQASNLASATVRKKASAAVQKKMSMGQQLMGESADVVELTAGRLAAYHSELAMQAAKRMRSTRQKRKTGQQVCHHLRMMLASDPSPRTSPRRSSPGRDLVSAEAQYQLVL
jgi:hypothetical protein